MRFAETLDDLHGALQTAERGESGPDTTRDKLPEEEKVGI